MQMKILVDENIPAAETCFGTLGQVVRIAGRNLQPADVRDADALIVRSITQVNEVLLEGSAVRFVGTATIGVDHIDQAYLQQRGMGFANAPGCNAQSVVDFVTAALLELENRGNFDLEGKTLGIVGLGNVGSRLQKRADRLGLRVLACDPPLQAQGQQGLVGMEEVWQADILSLHVPLIKDGEFPTRHLVNAERLGNLKPNAVLINTARGPAVDNSALIEVLSQREDLSVVLDVWEGEPQIHAELAVQVDLATPHIAGYSHDGKVRGTFMVYEALCRQLGLTPALQESGLMAPGLNLVLDYRRDDRPLPNCALDLVREIYDIRRDDAELRGSLLEQNPAQAFDRLRKQYPVRREFATVQVVGAERLQSVLPAREWQRLQALDLQWRS